MSLSTQIGRDFSAISRKRGENYFREGRVRIMRGGPDEVEAQVRGSYGTYSVDLDWNGEELETFCDLLEGQDAPVVTLDEGLQTVVYAEAVLQSAATGTTVKL